MMTSFELIDVESGNLVGSYASEEEARAVALRAYVTDGLDGVRALGLLRVRGDDQVLIAEGEDLARTGIATAAANSTTR